MGQLCEMLPLLAESIERIISLCGILECVYLFNDHIFSLFADGLVVQERLLVASSRCAGCVRSIKLDNLLRDWSRNWILLLQTKGLISKSQ